MKKMKINFPLQTKRKCVDSIIRVYKNPRVIKVMKEPAVKAISLVTIAMLVLGLVGMVAPFKTTATPAAENWRLSGNYTITFTCTLGCGGNYVHTMNVSLYDNNDGIFSGTGYYNISPSITWTVTGDVTGDTIGFLVDYDGSGYAVDADGTIAMDGTMSGSAIGPGQAFNWVMSPKATFYRYAEITSPAVDSIITDTLNLGAFLMDNDYDPVSWAVRKGTCAAATNTVMGNVDGFNSPFNWAVDAGNKYKYVFSASADVSSWGEGTYCFIFNPAEDGGEADIRMTEFFKVNWDADDDGVMDNIDNCLGVSNSDQLDTDLDGYGDVCDADDDDDGVLDDADNCPLVVNAGQADLDEDDIGDACDIDNDNDDVQDTADFCPETQPDTTKEFFSAPWGVHRWYWDDSTNFVQQSNLKSQTTPGKAFTLADTSGCSCKQILNLLKDAGLGEFGGHHKFGCSTSILEDFKTNFSDGDLGGRYFIETVAVPAIKSTDTLSVNPLALGINYILKARGTANAGDNIQFDARYSFRTGSSIDWTDSVSTYEGYGPTLLDLFYNGSTPWGAYNSSHEYEVTVPGTGSVATFRIYDVYYPNNTGNLLIDIYAQL